ncbi:hypothetical protein LPB86_17570 [Pedobacter sp. MC2016-14]|uniref:hypothetical protein n=1 Tax=Pedobacter sp. MC2016-14 TaxID=2897327 RepID=UPI001E627625|nr:hypothetical protein [Pedobacter sp. MC2016-14]MCD0490054.1 hypothetical protein [Pedobacter sp. MC2016-14]
MVLPLTFRVVVLVCLATSILFGVIISRSTKEKSDYDHVTSRITYLDQKLGDLPSRNLGSYRYLKIEGYQYPFEIYIDEQSARMDSLKIGDVVSAYFYQTDNTEQEGINRFIQFVEKDNKVYFQRGNIVVITCIIGMVGLILLSVWCYFLYKKGKIPY